MSQGVSVQGVSVRGVSVRGVYVLGVSVRGVHVRGGYVLEPSRYLQLFYCEKELRLVVVIIQSYSVIKLLREVLHICATRIYMRGRQLM